MRDSDVYEHKNTVAGDSFRRNGSLIFQFQGLNAQIYKFVSCGEIYIARALIN